MIEAVRSSVLSSRWRYIWTHLTIFDSNAITVLNALTLQGCLPDTEVAYNLTKGETNKFIQTVDSIVQQLQGARLNQFAVRYFLDKSHSHRLDAWVRYAVAAQTKLLALHLYKPYRNPSIEPYDFPCHLLRSLQSLEIFSLMFCSLKLPLQFDGFDHLKLKRLILALDDISQEDFSRIMSNNYSTLKRLCVFDAPRLVSISIPHPLSQLQNCGQLRKIDINAVNLHKLYYWDFQWILNLDNLQSWLMPIFVSNMEGQYTIWSSMSLNCQEIWMTNLPKGSCKFIHLRYLDWKWDDTSKMSLFDLAVLLDVAPFLEKLKLCLLQHVLEPPPQTIGKFGKMLPKHPHTHLKKIQVSGFYFNTWQIEIALYLLKSAAELESMTIKKGSTPSEEIHERGTAILKQEVPEKVKLVIL